MPSVSIIIPLYNKEKEIEKTIHSVLNQDFSDLEIVVVNDGSTDHSLDVVESIKDNRIRVITQQNAGVSAARNHGISEAKGKYVLLLDADDTLLPGALNLVSYAEDYDVVLGSFIQTDSQGEIVSKSVNSRTGKLDNVFEAYWNNWLYMRMGSFIVSKEYLNQVESFRTDICLYEDLEWLLRMLTNATVLVTSQIIMAYNRGETGLSRGIKPIDKDFAKLATVKKVNDNYKRRIIGDFVFRRFYSRFRSHDWKGMKVIWGNNSGRMLYCLMACVVSYYKKNKKKIKGDGLR